MKVLEVPCGYKFVEKVMEKVFWDSEGSSPERSYAECSNTGASGRLGSDDHDLVETDILMSAECLASLLEYSEKCDSTLDGALSFLQVSLPFA